MIADFQEVIAYEKRDATGLEVSFPSSVNQSVPEIFFLGGLACEKGAWTKLTMTWMQWGCEKECEE